MTTSAKAKPVPSIPVPATKNKSKVKEDTIEEDDGIADEVVGEDGDDIEEDFNLDDDDDEWLTLEFISSNLIITFFLKT